jgi:hypothetical protein
LKNNNAASVVQVIETAQKIMQRFANIDACVV